MLKQINIRVWSTIVFITYLTKDIQAVYVFTLLKILEIVKY